MSKLFDELAPRYSGRAGGYTRLVKIGPRRGDGAEMVIVELVDRPGVERLGTAAEASSTDEA